MNRLVRIALTFFISASVLTLLVSQRLKQLKINLESGMAEEAAKHEGQMITFGVIIAGALAAAGFVRIIIAMTRSRRKQRPSHD